MIPNCLVSVSSVFRGSYFSADGARRGTTTLAGLFFLLPLLLAGCETLPDRVKARFEEVPPKVRTFQAEKRDVYAAAQSAFKKLDWTLTRSVVSDGVVEAASPINRNIALGDSRQLVARLEIEDLGAGETEVSMRLTGQIESTGTGGRSQEAMREHSFFERYFAVLEEELKKPRA